jgi:hypothetical protein
MKRLGILVSSCDKYSDVWKPFFHFFFKHWPDCPYPVYLLTNHLEYPDPRVISLELGDDGDWSSALLSAVRRSGHEYLLYLQEDYFLLGRPDEAFFRALPDLMAERGAGYFRVFPCPGADRGLGAVAGHPYGRLSRLARYRVSLQAAVWRSSFFEKVLSAGENGWQLETLGTKRTRCMPEPMLGVMDAAREPGPPLDYFCTAVVKGRWMPEAVELCRSEGLAVDLESRGLYDPAGAASAEAAPPASGLKEGARRWLSRFF